MGENHSAWFRRRPRSIKNFSNGASSGCIARIHPGLWLRNRAVRNTLQVVYDHRRWRAGQFHLLPVAQDELHPSILDRALDEIGSCRGIHGHNYGASQEDPPKTSDPLGGVGTPEKDAIAWDHTLPGKRRTPEKGVGVELSIRRLFTTVAASLDDSDIAGKAGEVSKKTQEILSGHKHSIFFAAGTGRFYPGSSCAAFQARQTAHLGMRKHPTPKCTSRATKEQSLA